jgi:hypothetical protein
MVQRLRVLGELVAFLLLTAAQPARAVTWPCEVCGVRTEAQITVEVFNSGARAQQVRVAGRVYTVMPYGHLTLKAPPGTQVYAVSRGAKHRKGDLLFAFAARLDRATVTLD